MLLSSERHQHQFIVRLWYEPDATSEGQWRGSIRHAASGQQMCFISLADMTDFVALRLRECPGLSVQTEAADQNG